MKFQIKEAREKIGYSQKELAEIIGVAPNTFHGYESGKHDPKSDLLIKIAQACNVSVDFLLGRTDNPNMLFETKQHPVLSHIETEHIKKYRALDEHGKKMVDYVIAEETARMERLKQEQPPTKETGQIVYLPKPIQSASAGYGQLADDDTADKIGLILNDITRKADYIMHVCGDSMEPRLYDGQNVLVSNQPAVELGEIGIFIIGGERFIKIYRGGHLESANPEYPNVQFDEYSRCVGKVLGVLQDEWIIE